MINEKVLDFLKAKGYADRLTEHKETIDTVEHAAQQIGCSEAEIAKTLSFIVDEKPVIVVMAGVMSVRAGKNRKKARFYISAIFRNVFAVRIVIISPMPEAAVFFHQLAFAYSFRSKDQKAVFP